jgi:hypothetical protein
MGLLFPISMIVVHNYKMNNPSRTLEDIQQDYVLLNRFYQFVGIYLIVLGVLGVLANVNIDGNNSDNTNKMIFYGLGIVIGSILIGLHYSYNNEVSDDYETLKEQYTKLNNRYMIMGSVIVVLMVVLPSLLIGVSIYKNPEITKRIMMSKSMSY